MARERYLVGGGEDTIHDPEAEKKAEEAVRAGRGKWDNFWYYHKWHVLIAAAVVLIVIFSVVSALQTVRPDYNVGLISATNYPSSVTDQLGEEMAKYGDDLNHDGKVIVQVNMYQITNQTASSASDSSGIVQQQVDPQIAAAYQVKMLGDISTGTSMIFLTDDESFLQQERNGTHIFAYTDGTTPDDNATDYDRMRVSLAKCPKLANVTFTYQTANGAAGVKLADLFKDCSLSLRVYEGSSIEGKQDDYYKASKALFEKLIS
jgi:hypothetical protein